MENKPVTQATVVFLLSEEGHLCLARKKQPIHHASGEIVYSLETFNGYGGKREPEDRSLLHTAVRELLDESSVVAHKEDLELVARVHFHTPDKKTGEHIPFMDVSFFMLRTWKGEPREGSEMGPPEWFTPNADERFCKMPYGDMMPADKHILRRVFEGVRAVYQVKLYGKEEKPNITVLDEPLVVPK